ncbi:hypothetical protein AVEN_150530-1 [Araneus ventricosus]|uniref:Uncharacterized protein n=1 Tax=Araneus ventricosus TaxID=182803 RepID=A0A4Y2E5G8_ARAVE|nr:hypothetical protein AVEN_150530-1 [Araneus ventricosus]
MLENHTFDKKSEKPPVLYYRLAVLLNTRGTDVFNLGLDKQTKHSSRGVSLSCPGKDYLLVIRGTDVDPHKNYPLYTLKIIYITKQSDEELEDVLTYELCPFPLPLFEAVMRKGTKSSLYKAFKPCIRDFNAESSVYIIDGGYLLHRVIWKRGSTFSSICDNYVTCVRTSTTLVIFDRYPENETVGGTKCAKRARRTQKQMSSEVMFDETMIRTVS